MNPESQTASRHEPGSGQVRCMPWLGRVGLAYMQNVWVREPQKLRDSIERYGEAFRVRMIHKLLFMGCVSGRRLEAAFGADLLKTILWEEASREIAGDSKTICQPDPEHIRETLDAYKPLVVLTFGKIAGDAVAAIWRGPLIRCCHPAARQPETVERLKAAATEYAQWANLQTRPNDKLRHGGENQ